MGVTRSIRRIDSSRLTPQCEISRSRRYYGQRKNRQKIELAHRDLAVLFGTGERECVKLGVTAVRLQEIKTPRNHGNWDSTFIRSELANGGRESCRSIVQSQGSK